LSLENSAIKQERMFKTARFPFHKHDNQITEKQRLQLINVVFISSN